MSTLTQAEIQPDTGKAPLDSDYLSSLGLNKLGLGLEEVTPPAGGDPPAPVPGSAPVQPVPQIPPTPGETSADIIDQARSRPEAQKRVEEKNYKKRVEELEAELAELRPFKTKTGELETSLTEFKTLAEQKENERKALAEAYRNEAATVPNDIVYELPEVREAFQKFEAAGKGLFPRDLSDPHADEPVRSFSPASLTDAKRQQIVERIDAWEKQQLNESIDPDVRADIQHVIVSQIAMIAGVKPDRFVYKNVGGTDYAVLPGSHPVYQHLARSIEPFVEARGIYTGVENNARQQASETLAKAVQGRMSTAKARWAENGVGISGDALKEALARNPDNQTLQAMQLIEAHADLLAEVQQNAELEALTTGHSRTHLDLVEMDPNERTTKARALLERVHRRDLNAPLMEPLKKLAVRQAAELADLRKKLAAAEGEASRTRTQAEAGSAGASGDNLDSPIEDQYAHIARRLGLP